MRGRRRHKEGFLEVITKMTFLILVVILSLSIIGWAVYFAVKPLL
jgi:hypothetical protein